MIIITKDEAEAIREKFGDEVHITISNRQKRHGRKRYYVEESRRVTFFLDRYKNGQVSGFCKRGAQT